MLGLPREIAQRKLSQDKGKEENSFISLPGRYMHLKIIPKGVLPHTGIPRDIKESKMPTKKFGHF